jgi:ribonuclease BN (tRNA processing enzyme)
MNSAPPTTPNLCGHMAPLPFPGIMDLIQRDPSESPLVPEEQVNPSHFGWREWASEPFLLGRLLVAEPWMAMDLSNSEDFVIKSVIGQCADIAEIAFLHVAETSEIPTRSLVLDFRGTPPPPGNHAVSQQLRSILQKRRLEEIQINSPEPQPRVVISFLGTGCASPSRHRSNSAILFQFNNPLLPCSLLLDAGECCVAQLFQACQGDDATMRKILQTLSVIWISHHHADHHCGLSHLLEEIFRSCRGRKILVIAPATVISYHQYIACVGGFDEIVEFVPIELTLNAQDISPTRQLIIAATNGLIQHFQSIRVPHCHDSFGVMFKLSNQEKYVYSGDCRPSKQLASLGLHCHVLIHEATFEDDRISDAKQKRHSTISEGIQMGVEMSAKHTILTHLSQRYPRTPPLQQCDGNVTIAHDFLRVLLL